MGATAGIVGAANSVAGGLSAAQAAEAQGEFSRNQSEANARLQEAQAKDIELKGQKDAGLHRRKVRGLIGKQKASLAAQGIDIGVGSAAAIQEETAEIGEQDASQIRINAIRQAFGQRVGAINTRAQGESDQIAGQAAAANALLTGGLGAVQSGLSGFNFDAKPQGKPKGNKAAKGVNAGQSRKDFSNFA